MNRRQLVVLWIGVVLTCILLLFPPQVMMPNLLTFWEMVLMMAPIRRCRHLPRQLRLFTTPSFSLQHQTA